MSHNRCSGCGKPGHHITTCGVGPKPAWLSQREQRAKRIAAGMCRDCGKGKRPDAKRCDSCLEKNRIRRKEARLLYISEGDCPDCGRPKEKDRYHCPLCSERHNASYARRAERRKEAGICVECGKAPPTGGSIRCTPCRARHAYSKERPIIKAREAAGTCLRCGDERAPNSARLCRVCLEIHSAKQRELRRKSKYENQNDQA